MLASPSFEYTLTRVILYESILWTSEARCEIEGQGLAHYKVADISRRVCQSYSNYSSI